MNPSVGAGLGVCTQAQYAAETALSDRARVVPTARRSATSPSARRSSTSSSKARSTSAARRPDDPAPGAENPFDSLVAVYLVAKAPARGVHGQARGRDHPDPDDGDLTAIFDGLPQLPYTDLEINFRTGQRAFLITPARLRARPPRRSR